MKKINQFAHKMSAGILHNTSSLKSVQTIDDTLNSWFNLLLGVSFYLYINTATEVKIQAAENSYTCLMLYVKALDI